MRLSATLLFLISTLLAPSLRSPASINKVKGESLWQVIITYDSSNISVSDATIIDDFRKSVAIPGARGSVATVDYEATWLDSTGKQLISTDLSVPLGQRVILDNGEPCVTTIPHSGAVTIRLSGPNPFARPKSLRISRTSSPTLRGTQSQNQPLPPVFEFREITLPLTLSSLGRSNAVGPVSATKVRDTGPDGNRLVIVVLGDGYTAANLAAGDFDADVQTLLSAFDGRSPWDILFNATNVYQIDVESAEQGADNDPKGTFVDTYFNSTFWTGGIERALTVDGVGYQRAVSAANTFIGPGLWDELVMLVNSDKYGGTGGAISVSSVHAAAPEIILHEVGHTFAGLADEYDYGGSAPPGFTPEPNVDLNFSPPKWSVWIEPGVPLPTPAQAQYDSVVGAFEGAAYYTSGVYRPWNDCLMRTLGQELGPICKEAHMIEFANRIQYSDSSTPPATTVYLNDIPQTFSVAPIPLIGLKTEWRINGEQPTCSDQLSLTLSSDDLPQNTNTVTVSVDLPTSLVRQDTLVHTYSWTVFRDCNSNFISDSLDILAGAADVNGNWIIDNCEISGCCQTPGDADSDGATNIADVTFLISRIFAGGAAPACEAQADADGSGAVNIADVTHIINFIFAGGSPPVCATAGTFAWSAPPCSLPHDLHALWGFDSSTVFAVGDAGQIYRKNSVGWAPMSSGSGGDLRGIWGVASNDMYTAGFSSGQILHYDGSTWSAAYNLGVSLTDIWGTANDNIFATGFGTVFHFDGSQWNNPGFGVFGYFNAVWGAEPDDVFAVGAGGNIRRYNGASWTSETSGVSQTLLDVWGTDANNVIAVGVGGLILRYNGSNWVSESSGTTDDLYAIWGLNSSTIYIAGDNGVILESTSSGWSPMTVPVSANLRDIWGPDQFLLYGVGKTGTLLEYSAP